MKIHSTILLFVLLLFIGCTKEHKAKKAIQEELRLTLHDWNNYEPVQFGKMEVAFSSYEDEPEIDILFKKADAWLEIHKTYSEKADSYRDYYLKDDYFRYERLRSQAFDTARAYMDRIKRFELEYKPKIIGWQFTHSYRAKNLAGNLGIHHYLFTLNKDCSKVIKSIDISEVQKEY